MIHPATLRLASLAQGYSRANEVVVLGAKPKPVREGLVLSAEFTEASKEKIYPATAGFFNGENMPEVLTRKICVQSAPEVVSKSDFDTSILFRRYGLYQTQTAESGDNFIVLPTCSMPLWYLDTANWAQTSQMGNLRSVRSVDSLRNGVRPHLVVKSPERVFTAECKLLEKGYFWWGGPRSGERAIRVTGNPIIEQQAIWEALILLELVKEGVKVETPQAIVTKPDGRKELIVEEIPSSTSNVILQRPRYEEILRGIKESTTIIPVDASEYNCIRSPDGFDHIIDVNRWFWPPHTDSYRMRLLSEITNAVLSSREKDRQKYSI